MVCHLSEWGCCIWYGKEGAKLAEGYDVLTFLTASSVTTKTLKLRDAKALVNQYELSWKKMECTKSIYTQDSKNQSYFGTFAYHSIFYKMNRNLMTHNDETETSERARAHQLSRQQPPPADHIIIIISSSSSTDARKSKTVNHIQRCAYSCNGQQLNGNIWTATVENRRMDGYETHTVSEIP